MTQESLNTRSRILEAAQNLFSRTGYDATGVAEICAAAGVSKGAFYYHFASKQAVFLELLNHWLKSLDAQFYQIRKTDINIPDTLIQMASIASQIIQAGDGRLPIFLEFWTQSSRDPAVWQATIAPYRRYVEFLRELVLEGISQGSFKELDPEIASRLILALAVGILFQGLIDTQGTDWQQVAQQGMRYLMEGLRKE